MDSRQPRSHEQFQAKCVIEFGSRKTSLVLDTLAQAWLNGKVKISLGSASTVSATIKTLQVMQMLNDGCEFFSGLFHLTQSEFPFCLKFPVSSVPRYAGTIRYSIV